MKNQIKELEEKDKFKRDLTLEEQAILKKLKRLLKRMNSQEESLKMDYYD